MMRKVILMSVVMDTIIKLKKMMHKASDHAELLDREKMVNISKSIKPVFTDEWSVAIVDVSPNLYLVSKAARVCVNKPIDESIEERKKYIKRLAEMGHESPLEHSNIIAVISVTQECYPALIYIMENAKYVNTFISSSNGKINLLIGGSIRGFLHIVREFNNKSADKFASNAADFYINRSYAVDMITSLLYNTTEKEFLQNLIKFNLLDEDRCNYELVAPISTNSSYEDGELVDEEAVISNINDPKYVTGERVDLIYNQDVVGVYKRIRQFGFTIEDACKVCTVSFLFHDVSRSCANQMTRHRVAISQESQRYCKVDITNDSNFVDPIALQKDGRYKDLDPGIQEDIIDEINVDKFTPYSRLINVGIVKEDARAWLPMNVTTKLMMTFTYKQAAQFIDLRSSKGAQFEVRLVAEEMKKHLLTNRDVYNHAVRSMKPIATTEDIDNYIAIDDDIQTTIEEMKPLDISSPESAKAYMEAHEELKKIKEEDI